MTARLDRSTSLLVAGLACLSLMLGVVAGMAPTYAIVGAVGIGFVAVVLQDVRVGVGALVLFAYVDTLPTSGLVSPAKVIGLLVAASWLAAIMTRRETQLLGANPWITWLIVLFLAWQALSITWAQDRPAAIDSMVRYLPNLLLLPIIFTATRKERDLVRILWIVVGASLLVTLIAFANPPADPAGGDVGRAYSTVGDANQLAASLVVGLVFALALASLRRYSPAVRAGLVVTAFLCLVAIFLSLSRGGLLALSAAMVAAILLSGRYRARAIAGASFVVVSAVVYFAFFASLPARERVTQVNGGTGRVDLWTVGWRMFKANPITGVGGENFPDRTIDYILQPGVIKRDDFIITDHPLIAHNTFLQIVTEGGIPALALFALLICAALWCALRASRLFERAGRQDLGLLARAVIVAFAGFMTAGFFISANYMKLLWILLALGPAALWLARRELASSSA